MSKPVHNAYPELPELDCQPTQLSEAEVVDFMKTTLASQYPLECLLAAFTIWFEESDGGKKGINGNYAGVQADGAQLKAPWDGEVIGTVLVRENMTGDMRRFVVFNNWQTGIQYEVDRLYMRGLYIGGYAHPYANQKVTDVRSLAICYGKEWVQGDKNYQMPEDDIADFALAYYRAQQKFA